MFLHKTILHTKLINLPFHWFLVEEILCLCFLIFQGPSEYAQKRGIKNIYGDTPNGITNLPDMVVIEFDEPFNLKPGIIEPACLPTQEITIGSSCYTSGWGQLGEELGTSFALKALSVEVINIQGFMKEITETL